MIVGAVAYKIISDERGSVRFVVNAATGATAEQIEYDEFGTVLSDTNPGFQPFGYAGGLYDQTTHLLHFGAREYDASVGRWLSKDPLLFGGRDTNLYGYAFNDPVNATDLTGLASCDQSPINGNAPATSSPVWMGTQVAQQTAAVQEFTEAIAYGTTYVATVAGAAVEAGGAIAAYGIQAYLYCAMNPLNCAGWSVSVFQAKTGETTGLPFVSSPLSLTGAAPPFSSGLINLAPLLMSSQGASSQ
jgi:RHS repeat-associated protein